MLVAHSACALVFGVLAALASCYMGLSVWMVIGAYVLGGNIGLGVSLVVVVALEWIRGPRQAMAPQSHPSAGETQSA